MKVLDRSLVNSRKTVGAGSKHCGTPFVGNGWERIISPQTEMVSTLMEFIGTIREPEEIRTWSSSAGRFSCQKWSRTSEIGPKPDIFLYSYRVRLTKCVRTKSADSRWEVYQ